MPFPPPFHPALTIHTASVSEIIWKSSTFPPFTVSVEASIPVTASLNVQVTVYTVPEATHIPLPSLEIVTVGGTASLQCAYSIPLSINGNETVSTNVHHSGSVYHPSNAKFVLVGVVTPDPATTQVVFAVYFFVGFDIVLHPLELYVILHALVLFCNQLACTPHLHG
jgi:hypothetical protein